VEAVAAKAARLDGFVAVPVAQRYGVFALRARELLDAGRLGPLSHTAVRDVLDHWRRGEAPSISVRDCARVVR
jgi:predicted dehydrogenase